MRKLAYCFLAALALMLCACSAEDAALSASAPATVSPAQTMPPAATPAAEPTPTAEESQRDAYFQEQAAIAEACRIQTEDAEYFFDTSQYFIFSNNIEFPLYRSFIDSNVSEYLGTTGYYFQLCDPYIYIKSNNYTDEEPQGEITRVVDLTTGDVLPCNWNMDIYIPNEGELVYYTIDSESSIFAADPSLTDTEEYAIDLPERREITRNYGDFGYLYKQLTITGVADGWLSFRYKVSKYNGPTVYVGSYRIRTDGTGLEKTDEGQYY